MFCECFSTGYSLPGAAGFTQENRTVIRPQNMLYAWFSLQPWYSLSLSPSHLSVSLPPLFPPSLPCTPGQNSLHFWVSLRFPQKHDPNTTCTMVIASYQQSSGQMGRWADCVFFNHSKLRTLSWLGRGGRKQRETILMVSRTDKIQKLKMAVTAEQVNPVFFPEHHCGYLVCRWSHRLCTCLSVCVSQGDGEHTGKVAAGLCTAYPSHGAVNYKQVLLNIPHKALVAPVTFSLIKRSIKVYPKF